MLSNKLSKLLLGFTVIFFVSSNGYSLPADTSKYDSPTLLTSWDGGINNNQDYSFHYRTINIYCHTLGFQYKRRFELGGVITGEGDYSAFAKYHIPISSFFTISPAVILMNRTIYDFSIRPSLKLSAAKPSLGITASLQKDNVQLRGSYYKVDQYIRTGTYSEVTSFLGNEIGDNLISGQLHAFFERSHISLEYRSFKTYQRGDITQSIREQHAIFTAGYKIKNHSTIEIGFWTRLNNHHTYCDLICFDSGLRLSFSTSLMDLFKTI